MKIKSKVVVMLEKEVLNIKLKTNVSYKTEQQRNQATSPRDI